MKGFAAVGAAAVVSLSTAAQAQPLEPAPVAVTCAASPSAAPLGRPIRCEVMLDLSGQATPLVRSAPQIVDVSRQTPAPRRAVIDEPGRPETRAIWVGQAVLTAQPAAPACADARPGGEEVWFPRAPRPGVRRGEVPVVEPRAGSCAGQG